MQIRRHSTRAVIKVNWGVEEHINTLEGSSFDAKGLLPVIQVDS